MDYGEVFGGTFRLMWQEKRLWVLGVLGTTVGAIGYAVYFGLVMSWQQNLLTWMIHVPSVFGPEEALRQFGRSMGWLLAAFSLYLLALLVNYLLRLVARGGIIAEGAASWRGERVELSRGLRVGLSKAVSLFVLDLLWRLPDLLVAGGSLALFLLFMLVTARRAVGHGQPLAGFGAFLLVLLSVGCLLLLIAIVRAIFSPLMYQALVQGGRGLGQAITEGWTLAQANLGTMIVFALLLFGLNLTMGLILQLATLPLTMTWMTSYFGALQHMFQGVAPPPPGAGSIVPRNRVPSRNAVP